MKTEQMNDVKKPYKAIIELLQKNENKTVKSILPQLLELCESKKKDSTVRYDDNGRVTEIFCYYHKVWETVDWYGQKSSSHSGYNTMCKIGVNEWTANQSRMKKQKEEVLNKVMKGELKPENVQKELERIEKEGQVIITREETLKRLELKEKAKADKQ